MGAGNSIGRLAAELALDSREFVTGSTSAQQALGDLAKKFTNIGQSVTNAGKTMTKGVTLPLAGIGATVIKFAADFEDGMKGVSIATEASASQMASMKQIALDVGNATTFGASEAAGAMEMLAKAGVSTTVIIDGAAKAVTNLAAAAGSELEPAASAISDTLAQFRMSAKDLPAIVNQITGAVNESKFSFEDFTYGMAQGGGVAASAGLSFREFATALAATSSQFESGADAGTSLKTFLLRLTPDTKKAAAAFENAGFSAYDATGKLKPLAEIAEDLRTKFGKLSEADLNATFKQMFGTDAIRTAIGLMRQGGDGIEDMDRRIAGTNAADQATKQMAGLSGQLEQLRGAFETLAIAVADTGLLTAFTSIVKHVANFVSWLAQTHPTIMKVVVAVAAFAAAMGPLMVVLGTLGAIVLPLFLVGIGPIGLAISALINPLGTVLTLLGRWGATALIAKGIGAALSLTMKGLLVALLPLAVPLASWAALGALIYYNWDKIAPTLWPIGDALRDLGVGLGLLDGKVAASASNFGTAFDTIRDRAINTGAATQEEMDKLSQALAKIKETGKVDPAAAESITNLVAKMQDAGTITPQEATKVRKALLGMWSAQDAAEHKTNMEKLGASISDALNEYLGQSETLGQDVQDDWATIVGAVDSAKQSFVNFTENANALARDIGAAFSKAVSYAASLYQGVKTWLQDKLGAVLDWVGKKLGVMGDLFFKLYDRVVGHSYIPDMVDEIGAHMSRLDSLMVGKAGSATKKTADKFRDLARDVQSIMAEVFPDQARLFAQRGKVGKVDDAEKAGLVSPEVAAGLRNGLLRGLSDAGRGPVDVKVEQGALDVTKGLDVVLAKLDTFGNKAGAVTVNVAKSFKDMAEATVQSLSNLANSIKGGGFLDILSAVVGLGLQLGSIGAFGKSIAGRINAPKIPGYASGTNFHPGGLAVVGERRPELVELPRGSRVHPDLSALGGGSRVVHNHFSGNLMTPEFWQMIQSGDEQAARAGAGLARSQITTSRQWSLAG